MEYYGQVAADYFVTNILKHKKNGYFVEIGSNHPINNNNSYKLESEYNWKGIMVEYDSGYLPKYQELRPNSIHIINDARSVNYLEELKKANFPKDIDFLQIDLDVDNRSTLDVLERMNSTVFSEYKFATVIFETDIYRGDYFNTREKSREIFENNGYVRVFSDVMLAIPEIGLGDCSFEDWYVHPDLVDMSIINSIKQSQPIHFKDIMLKTQNYFYQANKLQLPLSEGEILDRFSILEIKHNHITDQNRKKYIEEEMQYYSKFDSLKNKYIIYYKLLYIVNTMIWDITNKIKEFIIPDEKYAKLSHQVFELNQSRFRLKNIINILANSLYKEQKSYNLKETHINIDEENDEIFKTLIYAILNYDTVFIFINKTLNNKLQSRIKFLFPTINLLDERCETNLVVDFNSSINLVLTHYIDNQLKNLLNPIFYRIEGTLEETILCLSVINENYIKTGRKGVLLHYYPKWYTNNELSIIYRQDYIQDYKVGSSDTYDIDLNSWRRNALLYKSSWNNIFKSEYGVDWGKHSWIKTINDDTYHNTIVLFYCQRQLPISYKELLSQYNTNDILLIGFSDSDKNNFANVSGMNLSFKLCKTIDDMAIIINSCKLFITTLAFPLTLTQALHHNTLALLDDSMDTIHNLLSDTLPNYTIFKKTYKYNEYHGEHQEGYTVDQTLRTYFPGEIKGVFFDVGAFEPIRISNSYHFEQNEWDCYCFEANTDNIPLLTQHRKNVFNYAIADENKDLISFNVVTDRGWTAGFSAINVSEEYKQIFGDKFESIKQINVPQKSLNSIIETEIPNLKEIDIMSVDVEGGELNVLKGLDLNKYKPKVIVIENVNNDSTIIEYLKGFNYKLDKHISYNQYFVHNTFIR